MPIIGAVSGDNSVIATYYFPDLSVYETKGRRIRLHFNSLVEG
jgi:hypothetical protein